MGPKSIIIHKGRYDKYVFLDADGSQLSARQLGRFIIASGDPKAISLYRSWRTIHTISGSLLIPGLGTLAYGTATFIFPGLNHSLTALLTGVAVTMISGGVRLEFQDQLVAAVERYNEVISSPPY
jgi:hypothetical protein